MEKASERFRFHNLDSIRSIAFFTVFLAHAFYAESDAIKTSSAYLWTIQFQEALGFGVPIFFVLSGFLITYLMLKEQNNQFGFSLKNFYMRRILRIWPVYFIVLLIGFVLFPMFRNLVLHQPYLENANPLYYISFLSNFDQLKHTTLPFGIGLGPTWSVSIEEQFYLLWPLLLLLFPKKKFIIGVGIVLMSSLVLTPLLNLPSKHTLYCMMYLSIGGLFAYLSFYHTAFIRKITNVSSLVFLLGVVLLITSLYFSSNGYGSYYLTVFMALLIAYSIVFQIYSGKMELRKIPFLERMGKYTYGLYLYHVICNFIAHILIDDVMHFKESNLTVLLIKPLISLSLSLTLAYFSYNYMEQFFFRLKDRFKSKID
jgi:peptidoglycan/LPS O-acetylase OafA/YrhL